MKSPFAILLAVVVLVGIIIGVAAIFLLNPTDQDDEEIPVASSSELPTPSTRSGPERPRAESNEPTAEAPEILTDESPDLDAEDETIETETDEPEDTTNEEPAQGGRGQFGGGDAGGPGGGNFQAIQEAIESNPEIAALIQKAQTGNISQAEQARLRELMEEALADAGIEIPGVGQGGGFGTPPTQGTITYIFGSTITVQDLEDTETTTDVEVGEDTNITIINSLDVSDLPIGTNVNGVVRRGEGGKIFIVSLDVAPQNPGGGFGFGGFGGAGGDNTVSAIQGTITEVNGDMVHVETTQGTLRLTANDKSVIVSTTTGTLTDLTEGMGVVAIGPLEDGAIQARTIIAGSQEFITQQNGGLRGAGRRAQGQ